MLAAGTVVLSMLAAGVAEATPLKPVTHANWMQKKQLIEGDVGGDLALERGVTTAEAATMLARLKGETKLQADPGIPHWASAQMAWAVKQDFLTADQAKQPDALLSASQIMQSFGKASYNVVLADTESVKRDDFFNA